MAETQALTIPQVNVTTVDEAVKLGTILAQSGFFQDTSRQPRR
jgi:hypothetical protein